MSPSTITLLFLAFAIVMFVTEKIPLGLTSMIVCVGLAVTKVLDLNKEYENVLMPGPGMGRGQRGPRPDGETGATQKNDEQKAEKKAEAKPEVKAEPKSDTKA